jgi:acetyl esterase/lipase
MAQEGSGSSAGRLSWWVTRPSPPRLEENIAADPIEAPLLIGRGAADRLILPAVQQRYVDRLCERGQPVDHRRYAGRDHVPMIEEDSPLTPELIRWTHHRFAGEEPTPNCRG